MLFKFCGAGDYRLPQGCIMISQFERKTGPFNTAWIMMKAGRGEYCQPVGAGRAPSRRGDAVAEGAVPSRRGEHHRSAQTDILSGKRQTSLSLFWWSLLTVHFCSTTCVVLLLKLLKPLVMRTRKTENVASDTGFWVEKNPIVDNFPWHFLPVCLFSYTPERIHFILIIFVIFLFIQCGPWMLPHILLWKT